jgi:hypothetical protein
MFMDVHVHIVKIREIISLKKLLINMFALSLLIKTYFWICLLSDSETQPIFVNIFCINTGFVKHVPTRAASCWIFTPHGHKVIEPSVRSSVRTRLP